VVTDKGRVKVTRGADHLWEVQKNGEKTEYFEKIGKNILPEAAEVVGLSMVKLGDIEMPVNIMNQLEGHFMLSELNGKSATGSLRAQIIDEISGLSGIEGIIKEVSLDNHRWGREVKQLEDRVEEIAEQKHDPAELDAAEALLGKVKKCIDDKKDCDNLIAEIETICDKVVSEGESIEEIDDELKGLPNEKGAGKLLDAGLAVLQAAKDAKKMLDDWQSRAMVAKTIEDELAQELDVKTAQALLQEANAIHTKVASMKVLSDKAEGIKAKVFRAKRGLKNIGKEMKDAEEELESVLSTIKVCPLTQLPVGPSGCGNKITNWLEGETAREDEPEPEPEVEELEDEEDGFLL
jgi:hypothetical protein